MSVRKLLDDFSLIDTGPVSLNAIVAELRARGIEDKIQYFRDEALDPRIVRGYLHRVETSNEDGSTSYTSTIVHARMSEGEERLVCAKELIHILDPNKSRVADRDRLDDLLKKIVLPPEVVDIVEEEEAHFVTDRDAILEAVALLFPLALRNKIYGDYVDGRISPEWIADKVELPVEYIAPAMNGFWPLIVKSLTARRQRLEEVKAPARPARKVRFHYG